MPTVKMPLPDLSPFGLFSVCYWVDRFMERHSFMFTASRRSYTQTRHGDGKETSGVSCSG